MLVTLFLSTLAGALVGVSIGMAKGSRSMQVRLPFGTFLAVAAYIASLVGEDLLHWYMTLYQ